MGLGFHFVIALTAATVYVVASRVLPFLIAQPVISGIAYGVCVYAVMYCVVLRVSAIRATTWPWSLPKSVVIGGLLIHMFGIGLPIALVNRHYSK